MQKENFLPVIRDLTDWYGRKQLNTRQIEMWYQQFRNTALEPFQWACELWMRTQRNLPTPQQLRDLLVDYWKAHPEKRAREDKKRAICDECDSRGYFDVWYDGGQDSQGHQIWYNKALPCAMCNNWRRCGIFPPDVNKFWTQEQIINNGFVFENPALDRMDQGRVEADTLDELGEQATQRL